MKNQSSQRRWQVRQSAAGKCVYCANQAINGTIRCEFHAEYMREYMRKRSGYSPWKEGGRGRPPKEFKKGGAA